MPVPGLKSLIARRSAMILPGVANALFARVAEELGYEAIYVSGAGIANMHLGAPDIGLVTMSELVDVVMRVSDVVSVPIFVDADTGFGNAVNMVRTTKALERAGASAIQIEDQIFPKKCGHFSGKDVAPLGEMLGKIKAAVDTRTSDDLLIVARTDSAAIHGLDHAIERAHAFVEVGADVTFVEAPRNEAELQRIAREIPAPQVANIVHGGLTPEIPAARLREMGFSIVLYANATLQAALKASRTVLQALKTDGSLANVRDELCSFEDRQRVVKKPLFDALEERYGAAAQNQPSHGKRTNGKAPASGSEVERLDTR